MKLDRNLILQAQALADEVDLLDVARLIGMYRGAAGDGITLAATELECKIRDYVRRKRAPARQEN